MYKNVNRVKYCTFGDLLVDDVAVGAGLDGALQHVLLGVRQEHLLVVQAACTNKSHQIL